MNKNLDMLFRVGFGIVLTLLVVWGGLEHAASRVRTSWDVQPISESQPTRPTR
jgi:hypothetical protein